MALPRLLVRGSISALVSGPAGEHILARLQRQAYRRVGGRGAGDRFYQREGRRSRLALERMSDCRVAQGQGDIAAELPLRQRAPDGPRSQ